MEVYLKISTRVMKLLVVPLLLGTCFLPKTAPVETVAAVKIEEKPKEEIVVEQPAPVVEAKPPAPKQNIAKSTPGVEQWRPLVAKYDWPVNTALDVMRLESGGNQYSANTTDRHRDRNGNVICIGSYGLFQIACLDGVVYDAETNIAIAYRKWKARGWQPWTNTANKLGLPI
jgi:hypothetical protein